MENKYIDRFGKLAIRKAYFNDVEYIAMHMKDADILEVGLSNCYSPYEALSISFNNSDLCLTGTCDGFPCLMFGTINNSIIGDRAVIWALGTDDIMRNKKSFYILSKRFIDKILDEYSVLYNVVYEQHEESIRWLTRLGAKFLDKVPYGPYKVNFIPFVLRRS